MKRWVLSAVAVALAIIFAYHFLDRAISGATVAYLRPWLRISVALTRIAEYAPIPFTLTLFYALAMVVAQRPISPRMEPYVRIAVGFCVTVFVKDRMKHIFGRTWPEKWIANNPSWHQDQVFGFFPFHGGLGWEAFPSGHTAAICYLSTTLWILWPRGRPLWGLAAFLVAGGLLAADYHWLSDIIGGAALGVACGVATMQVRWPARASV
jgi:membrane-associated phospholipid phosphatase